MNILTTDVKEAIFISVWLISPIPLIIYGFKRLKSKDLTYFNRNDGQNSLYSTGYGMNARHFGSIISRKIFFGLIISLFIIFLFFYLYLLVYGEDFVYPDNAIFNLYSLRDRSYRMPIWGEIGRFFPLGHQEFNIIRIFNKSRFGYHLFSIFQLITIIFSITFIFKELKLIQKLVILGFLILLPSFVLSFFGLIYPERNILFWLAIFIACVQTVSKRNSRLYFCGSLISTQFLLYYKEPMFLLVSGFALSRLIFQFSAQKNSFRRYEIIEFLKDKCLESSLLILSVLYIIFYGIVVIPNIESRYGSSTLNELETFIYYVKIDPIITYFICILSLRCVYLYLKKKSPDIIWDCLAIGATLYMSAYIKLGMVNTHYSAPFDFIAILYLGWLVNKILNSKRKWIAMVAIFLSILLFIQNLQLSSYIILSRKKFLEGQLQTTNIIKRSLETYQSDNMISLVFPDNSGFEIMTFSSFLDYKGFKLSPKNFHKGKILNNSFSTIVMKTLEKNPDDICMKHWHYKCYFAENIRNEDLIVFLPNFRDLELAPFPINRLSRKVGKEKLSKLNTEKFNLVFHYQPIFSPLEKLFLIITGFHPVSEQWLNSYIFKISELDKVEQEENHDVNLIF